MDGGAPGAPVSLEYGENVIEVVVTAADGIAAQTYTVTVTRALPDKPGPPQNLRTTATFDSLTVTWQAPGSGDAPDYYIARLLDSDGNAREVRLASTERTAAFRNLQSGATYTVGARGGNDGGEGDWSETRVTLPLPATLSSLTLALQSSGGGVKRGGDNLIVDPATTDYAVSVAKDVLAVSLTPTASRPPGATSITVDGKSVRSGETVNVASPRPGSTRQIVVVVREWGVERTYTVSLTRNG